MASSQTRTGRFKRRQGWPEINRHRGGETEHGQWRSSEQHRSGQPELIERFRRATRQALHFRQFKDPGRLKPTSDCSSRRGNQSANCFARGLGRGREEEGPGGPNDFARWAGCRDRAIPIARVVAGRKKWIPHKYSKPWKENAPC